MMKIRGVTGSEFDFVRLLSEAEGYSACEVATLGDFS
jgi:hypothetical protein